MSDPAFVVLKYRIHYFALEKATFISLLFPEAFCDLKSLILSGLIIESADREANSVLFMLSC